MTELTWDYERFVAPVEEAMRHAQPLPLMSHGGRPVEDAWKGNSQSGHVLSFETSEDLAAGLAAYLVLQNRLDVGADEWIEQRRTHETQHAEAAEFFGVSLRYELAVYQKRERLRRKFFVAPSIVPEGLRDPEQIAVITARPQVLSAGDEAILDKLGLDVPAVGSIAVANGWPVPLSLGEQHR